MTLPFYFLLHGALFKACRCLHAFRSKFLTVTILTSRGVKIRMHLTF